MLMSSNGNTNLLSVKKAGILIHRGCGVGNQKNLVNAKARI